MPRLIYGKTHQPASISDAQRMHWAWVFFAFALLLLAITLFIVDELCTCLI